VQHLTAIQLRYGGVEALWSGSFVEWKLCGVEALWSGSFVEWRLYGVETLWSGGFRRPAVGAPQSDCAG